MKSVRIRSFSGTYFPAFGLILERCAVSLRIQTEYGKNGLEKTPNKDTFHGVGASFDPFIHNVIKMAKDTLGILRCKNRKIFKVCLAIFQHYA